MCPMKRQWQQWPSAHLCLRLLEIFHQVQKVRKNWEHKKNELFTKQTGNDWSEADGKIHQKLNG